MRTPKLGYKLQVVAAGSYFGKAAVSRWYKGGDQIKACRRIALPCSERSSASITLYAAIHFGYGPVQLKTKPLSTAMATASLSIAIPEIIFAIQTPNTELGKYKSRTASTASYSDAQRKRRLMEVTCGKTICGT